GCSRHARTAAFVVQLCDRKNNPPPLTRRLRARADLSARGRFAAKSHRGPRAATCGTIGCPYYVVLLRASSEHFLPSLESGNPCGVPSCRQVGVDGNLQTICRSSADS